MTTTAELIEELTHESIHIRDGQGDDEYDSALLTKAAQRLRELDKPDCVWHKVGETFDTACNARYRDGAYSTWKTCPNCGGSVKASR